MKTKTLTQPGAEREHSHGFQISLISWKSIFSGLLVALIAYSTLIALGISMGGASASNIIQYGGNASGLATGAAIWMLVSVLLSLAAGGYFAARTSVLITGRMGAAQGLVIAALFFGFMMYGAGQTLGMAGSGLSNALGTIGAGVGSLSSHVAVQNAVENNLGGVNLKSTPAEVVQGLISRLLQGDNESAKMYLSAQTGLPPAEIDARYARIENDFKTSLQSAGMKAAEAVANTGMVVFWMFVAGIAAATLSGAAGTRLNFKMPIADETRESFLGRPVTIS